MNDPIEIAAPVLIGVSSLGILTGVAAFGCGPMQRIERRWRVTDGSEATTPREAVDHAAREGSEPHERPDFAEWVSGARRVGGRIEGGQA